MVGADFVRLRIRYRMLREGKLQETYCMACSDYHTEVEGFIDSAVKGALGGSTSPADHDRLVEVFVQALESDASWVNLYGITGELIVPDVPFKHEHLRDSFKTAKEV